MKIEHLLWFIPLLPFLGFVLNGTIGRRLPRAGVAAIALLFTALPAALVAWLWQHMLSHDVLQITAASSPWIQTSALTVRFAFMVDHLTLIMLAVVTGVGFLIHIYSAGYMAQEEGYWRFFAFLNLFMFFMLVLVLAESFLLLFVGWEGVGLASYLLIGFYWQKPSANAAGRKAFVANRVGDFGFLLAMFLMIQHFGTLSFVEIFSAINHHPELHGGFLTAIALLLLVGAAGKSAQIPLYVWLPDAMEGPTPVSALIHAATMVTAGVYLVCRSHVLFDRSPYALGVVAIIGAATALFAATIGVVQHDIKRVLAYSTISQLGYMFLGCGVAAYSAAVFHLMTHAFFKALLFLAAGSVIHALSGEQDMRVMGGMRKRTPITFLTMSAGVIAIAGIPPLAGFFSKDEILYRTFSSPNPLHMLLWVVGVITAGLTSFYMFRLWFKTFFGAERFDEAHLGADAHAAHHAGEAEHDSGQAAHSHGVHESPWVMLAPLVILAILSVVGGWVGIPQALGGSNHFEHFLDPVFALTTEAQNATNADQVSHGLELGLAGVSVLVALIGFLAAYVFYYKKPGTLGAKATGNPVYNLVANKYYVDELYEFAIITPIQIVSRVLFLGLVDTGIVNGSGSFATFLTRQAGEGTRRMQSGNIRSYAGWLAAGAAAVILLMTYSSLTQHATKAALHLK
ncbi:NADH dehydrogenase subunit L [Terriglobus roseus DSM 18391]|uniref:NADH dehydrogenase subunit L n=1 Tax=Terriglobus roseus (strain DSM 18391 / NRRL B-41598 / KBS 63) TaxID=926566 RepID=I3ZF57_TERRK|nr:NADH-quinone oxidoreductase subunit L [Terriglobus roseus]AFL87875.1 NADH dehydrogenase subunit L [Terriglobus roseus DSM 18391]